MQPDNNTNNKKSFPRSGRLVVLGAGESGIGAAVLGLKQGYDVFVSDAGAIPEKRIAQLKERDIAFEAQQHTEELILNADVVVKSPGIPPTAPLIKALVEKGIPIVSEIEFAAGFTDAKMICITGSNGKTTTTMLIHHILVTAGIDAGLAGNVGRSLALQVAEDPHDCYVVELSSFQLENMYDFKAHIAVLLNITPDHLDRYDYKIENYAAAKFRILRNQGPDDYFIYWLDDPMVRKQVEQMQLQARILPFSEHFQPGDASWTENGIVHYSTPEDVWEIPRDRLSLTGLHNLYNSMAAGLSATAMKINSDKIRKGLENFEAVEHRLEFVAEKDGVKWINDSKATNVNSTWYALESMTSPTILILGGKDKGNDYSEIEPMVRQKVKAIVAMGVDNKKILEFFKDKTEIIADTHSIQEAVETAARLSQKGDTVLLSPCCASFDLFKSYEDRGRQFKQQVLSLNIDK